MIMFGECFNLPLINDLVNVQIDFIIIHVHICKNIVGWDSYLPLPSNSLTCFTYFNYYLESVIHLHLQQITKTNN